MNRKERMKKIITIKSCVHYSFAVVVIACLLLSSCTDDLFNTVGSNEMDGLQLNISTIEMADDIVAIGGSRSTSTSSADNYLAHTLQGHNSYNLNAHRMPLPLVGIHSAAASANNSGHSRASVDDIASTENFHDSLTIWGYTDDNTPLYDQILVKKVANWRTSVQWPYNSNDDYMKFYALSPSMESADINVTTKPNYSTAPVFTYKLPDTAGEMVDLLYGESSNISIKSGPTGTTAGDPWAENLGKDNKIVDLQFRHILTAVRFSRGVIPAGLTITGIELQGIPTSASYSPSAVDAATGTNGTWSAHTGSASYSIKTNFAGGSGTYIDNNQVFFVLPQTVGSGVKLNITLTDTHTGGKSHTLSCSLQGDVWKKGYTVNYMITIGEVEQGYYFTAEVAGREVEHSNSISNGSFVLHSYCNYKNYSTGTDVDSHHAANWSVSGYSTTGVEYPNSYVIDKPTELGWLRSVDGATTGTEGVYAGGDNATVNFSLNPQEYTKEASHENVLGNNSAASTLDLETHNPNGDSDGPETANCYIINRVGSYTFPLVYGNKTTGTAGAPVAEAACFKDHTGTTIAYTLIKDQIEAKGITDNGNGTYTRYSWNAAKIDEKNVEICVRGVLIWQDVAGLINTVSATTMYNQMSFNVNASKPGNAVIALQARKVTYTGAWNDLTPSSVNTYGDWETLWTWHIWMTDEVYMNTGGSYDNQYLNWDETNRNHIVTLKHTDDSEVAKILPVNLGWVPDEAEFGFYSKREGWVELKQVGSNNTIHVKITQHARQPLVTGTGTFYQWGRPTAFPAVRDVAGTARTIYDIENNDISANFELAAATNAGDAISKPFYVLQGTPRGDPNGAQDSWFDVTNAAYDNAMWSTASKTVYDPCPRGFCMPEASIFYGFTQTMATVESGAGKLNMYPEVNGQKNGERSKGGYFYVKEYTNATNPDRYYQMVYMPSTGQFHGNKTIGNKLNAASGSQLDNANGIYWTADYFNTSGAATEKAKRQECGLWITPEQSYSTGTADKPVFGFFNKADHKMDYYGTLKAIRPRKK